MYLKSVDGKILFEGRFHNLRRGVEMAVEQECDLSHINLRGANLCGAQMDKAHMPNACFWGANLNGANMAAGQFENADFRTANFLDSCLAEADCGGSNFDGAYFSKTIFTGTNLTNTRFSYPSIFSVDLAHTSHMAGAIYSHMGEVDCDLSHAPLIIRGLDKPIIFMDDCTLVGAEIKKISMRQHVLDAILSQTQNHKITINQ